MSARDEILTRVRENLRGVPDPVPVERPIGSMPGRPSDLERPEQRIARFTELLTSVGGVVTRVQGEAAAGAKLEELTRGADRILASDAELVGRLTSGLPAHVMSSSASREELMSAQVGVTTAQWGIAETGTLVLVSDLERHRLASLVPETHIALLETSAILSTLGEALDAVRGTELAGRTITFVTGPSRTADIELTLVVGVHGPRVLHVLLLDP